MTTEHFQKGGFPRAVMADKTSNFADRKNQGERVQQCSARHPEGDIAQRKSGIGMRFFILHSRQLDNGHGEPCPKTDQKRKVAVATT